MSKHIFRWFSLILMFSLLMVFSAVPVLAFDVRSGETVIINRGEIVDDDLYVTGNTIIIDGTINGDLWACGRAITINGVVKGSVMGVNETVNITGDVGHALRAVCRTLSISGNVERDVLVGCANLNVSTTAQILGTLLFGSGTAQIDGLIENDIIGGGGKITIGNRVKGDVKLGVGKLILLPTAKILGNLTYKSDKKADIQSGAQIAGATTHKFPEIKKKGLPFLLFSGIVGKVVTFLMALITGLILILVAPGWMVSIVKSIRTRPGPSVGWGAVILFVTPISAVIACITIIGIPLGLIATALYMIAIYLSQIAVGLFIGCLIIGCFRGVGSRALMIGALALGLVILRLLRLIPYAGFFIILATILFGLGAIVVSVRKQFTEAQR